MNIIITGSSGFIGFHLAKYLIKKNKVLGLDNHNSYYSKSIKQKRLSILKRKKNFFFKKINLIKKAKLEKIFKDFKPDIVFHIAGQPGVLYSLKNPKSYTINNVHVTKNICRVAKKFTIKKFIYASSSSVYGDQKKFPIKEKFKTNPKNPYAKTKLISEKIVTKSFTKHKTQFIIFRFFTVYGPYGRPDMFIHKLLNAIKQNRKIKLHNNGLNLRDFTYIDDVIKILNLTLNKNLNGNIYNICRSSPIITNELISLISKIYKKKIKVLQKTGFIKGEMYKTHGSNKEIKKYIGFKKFTNIKKGIQETIKIFKKINI
tara:strand:- start:1617 stop:2564 length:948 start_codon:yes stop_codon:yes gene_type:complete